MENFYILVFMSLSYFALLRLFQLFWHINSLQSVDIPWHVHVAISHVSNLPINSLLCPTHLFLILIILPTVCDLQFYCVKATQHSKQQKKFSFHKTSARLYSYYQLIACHTHLWRGETLLQILIYLIVGANILHFNINKRHPSQ